MEPTDLHFQADLGHGGPAGTEKALPGRDAIARRAYEISLSADGSTPERNWQRAEAELRNQQQPLP
jgi:hypothetical protein